MELRECFSSFHSISSPPLPSPLPPKPTQPKLTHHPHHRNFTPLRTPQTPTTKPTFHGAPDEHETLTTTLTQLRELHPELSDPQNVNHEHLLHLASYVVKEQAFMVPYVMVDGAARGKRVSQLVLCIWGEEV